VRGEISGFSRAASGHCYFNLKDPDGGAALRCAMFRRAAQLAGWLPKDGDAVELRGRLAVYEPRGELQFVVEAMQRSGAGALYERFLRLKALLDAEGLFDAAAKRALPPFPAAIGVVTSLGGAACTTSPPPWRGARRTCAWSSIRAWCKASMRRRRCARRSRPRRPAPRSTCSSSAAAAARSRTSGPSTTSASCGRCARRRCRW
jgi:hypothetical protein